MNAESRHRTTPALIPLTAFILVGALHFLWLNLLQEAPPAPSGWMTLPDDNSWLHNYLETGDYWLGYSYALSAAFAGAALQRYLKCRSATARNFALGGITFTGLLSVLGCFLIGCCGSPMLVVWLNLFGTAFLPFTRPAMAGITTLTIAIAWWWMIRPRTTENLQSAESITQHN